ACAAVFLCIGIQIILLSRPLWQEEDLMTNSTIALVESPSRASWERFFPKRVQELRARGTPVFIDFTSKWGLICQSIHFPLSTRKVEKKMQELGVVKMKADLTKQNPEITEALATFGRSSVPLYVLYSGDPAAEPSILPQVLTPGIILESLNQTAP